MKKNSSSLILCALFTATLISCEKKQDATAIEPATDAGKSVAAINDSAILTYLDSGACAMIHGLPSVQGTNYNGFPSTQATVWTYLGTPAPRRTLLRFAFNKAIASGCTYQNLVSAKLFLYQGDELGNNGSYYSIGHVPNDFEVRRVRQPWNPATVTWSNFSSSATTWGGLPVNGANKVVGVPGISTPFTGNQDNVVVDLTSMVKTMLQTGVNYGFQVRFPNGRETQPYRARTFASFTNSNVTARPVLKLYWQ